MLIFLLPIKKRLIVSFWTFFNFLGNQGELERTETTKIFVDAGVSFQSKTVDPELKIECLKFKILTETSKFLILNDSIKKSCFYLLNLVNFTRRAESSRHFTCLVTNLSQFDHAVSLRLKILLTFGAVSRSNKRPIPNPDSTPKFSDSSHIQTLKIHIRLLNHQLGESI